MVAPLKTKNRLLYGVGINDVDRHVWTKVNGKRVVCPFYSVWGGMLMRCYAEQLHVKRPSYIGCSVVDEWVRLTGFEKWISISNFEYLESQTISANANCVSAYSRFQLHRGPKVTRDCRRMLLRVTATQVIK